MVVHRICAALPGGGILHGVIYLQCVIVSSLHGPPLFLSRSPPPLHPRLNYSASSIRVGDGGRAGFGQHIDATTARRIQFSLDYEF
jgi:hypothetical protein